MKTTAALFFLGSLAAFGAAAFFVFYRGGGNAGVALELTVPREAHQGTPFDLEVIVRNDSEQPIGEAEITLFMPDSLALAEVGGGKIYAEKIGEIEGGGSRKKVYSVLPVFGAGDNAHQGMVRAKVSYALGRRGGFEAEGEAAVALGEPLVSLALGERGGEILGGAEFVFDILYENGSDRDMADLRLRAEYPSGFSFISASLEPDALNNYWRLGSLKAGALGKLSIRGSFDGATGDEFAVPVTLFGAVGEDEVPFFREEFEFTLAPSPIEVSMLVNGSATYVARLGDLMRYTVKYENKSGVALSDVRIRVSLSGDLYDLGTIDISAVPGSGGSILEWNARNAPGLERLAPGGHGEVSFSVRLKDAFPIARPTDKDFALTAEAELTSPTVPYYFSGKQTESRSRLTTKVAGRVSVDARGFLRGSDSGFASAGPFPPKVGEETQYVLRWVVRNFGTDVKDMKISAVLPDGVRWLENFQTHGVGKMGFDAGNKRVLWEVNEIGATRGVANAPLEAEFQVGATPDSGEAGGFQMILGVTMFEAEDVFTGARLSGTDVPVTTALSDDSSVKAGGGIVVR